MLLNVQPKTSSHLKLEEQNSGSEADKEKDSKFKDFPATSLINSTGEKSIKKMKRTKETTPKTCNKGEKRQKSIFPQAKGLHSTHLLVKIYRV